MRYILVTFSATRNSGDHNCSCSRRGRGPPAAAGDETQSGIRLPGRARRPTSGHSADISASIGSRRPSFLTQRAHCGSTQLPARPQLRGLGCTRPASESAPARQAAAADALSLPKRFARAQPPASRLGWARSPNRPHKLSGGGRRRAARAGGRSHCERLVEVGREVVGVLQADAEAD